MITWAEARSLTLEIEHLRGQLVLYLIALLMYKDEIREVRQELESLKKMIDAIITM